MKHYFRKDTKEKEIKEELDTESFSGLNEEERQMIEGVTSLAETTVKESMVPRVDGIFLDCNLSYNEIMQIIVESNFSRYPVYQDNIDTIIGILYAKDLLKNLYFKEKFEIKKLLRPALFVPESKKLDSLLQELKTKHVHMSIVIDEYGGVSGILCLEDVLEHIVGNIQDEFDNEGEELIKVDPQTFECDARMNIDELNSQLNLQLPSENFDTVGGFVFDLFGTVPQINEQISYQGVNFIVQELNGRQIKRIKLITNAKENEQNENP